MTFARFTKRHKLGYVQLPKEGKALMNGDFNIPAEFYFVQYLQSLSEDRDDSDGVYNALV